MKHADHGMYRRSHASFDEAVQRTRDALQAEGFGIITEIDVRATFRKKLDVAFPPYVILGACAPKLAREALSAEPDIGLLLVQNPDVAKLADEVEARLTRALDRATL